MEGKRKRWGVEEGEEGERTGGACEGGEGKGEKMEKRKRRLDRTKNGRPRK